MAVEVFEVVTTFGAVAGGEAFPESVEVERVVGLLHAVQLQVHVFFGVGRFNRCEHVAALTYKSHGFQSSQRAAGERPLTGGVR